MRTDSEISASQAATLTGSEPGLAAYWDFSEGQGTTATDRTTSQYVATLTNVQPLARLGQVRSVELLVDGEVVRNDVSFPFEDFSVRAPRLDGFEDPFDVQVRVIDTGGNIGLSDVVTVQPYQPASQPAMVMAALPLGTDVDVVPDVTPPQIANSNPEEGGVRSKRFRTLRLGFNESMDPDTLVAENFRLLGPEAEQVDILSSPAGNEFPLIDVQARKGDSEVQLTYARLVPGDYELLVNEAAVTDAAGNALGTSEQVALRFTVLDADAVFVNKIGGAWTGSRQLGYRRGTKKRRRGISCYRRGCHRRLHRTSELGKNCWPWKPARLWWRPGCSADNRNGR